MYCYFYALEFQLLLKSLTSDFFEKKLRFVGFLFYFKLCNKNIAITAAVVVKWK